MAHPSRSVANLVGFFHIGPNLVKRPALFATLPNIRTNLEGGVCLGRGFPITRPGLSDLLYFPSDVIGACVDRIQFTRSVLFLTCLVVSCRIMPNLCERMPNLVSPRRIFSGHAQRWRNIAERRPIVINISGTIPPCRVLPNLVAPTHPRPHPNRAIPCQFYGRYAQIAPNSATSCRV